MNAYQVVKDFEESVAKFAGSRFGVAVDNCTNAIFLCCKLLGVGSVTIPKKTYPSVPCSIIHAGGKVIFNDLNWSSDRFYKLHPYPIYDAAHLMRKDMYIKDSFMCVSFSSTKQINIGKGGMILTDDEEACKWFKKARYCGRKEIPMLEDDFELLGWNMYMTPEQAARGLILMNNLGSSKPLPMPEYPDLSRFKTYRS
jgi:dTDP-4-amino-4,6-dideoxygalactose transaminase